MSTEERPLRVAEFDTLFTDAVRSVQRIDGTSVSLELVPEAEMAARAADLVVRETGCCSFFTFSLVATGGKLHLEIGVPAQHADVLEALVVRAEGMSS